MYSSSLNDSASSPLPSPQELSHLRTELDSLHSIAQLTSQLTSTAFHEHYKLLSQSIAQLEEELECHKTEQEVVNNHLVDNRSVQNRICLIINEYQQKQALRFHPYSHTSGSPSMTPNTLLQPTTHLQLKKGFKVEWRSGSKKHPIIVLDVKEEKCEGCRGDHEFRGCARIPQPRSLKEWGSRKSRRIPSLAYKWREDDQTKVSPWYKLLLCTKSGILGG